jgi:two-component system, OmpR family, response regulator
MTASAKPKIIIVDDEQDLCFLLSGMLRTHGFEVDSYYTLQTGLTAINNLKPDWVIMDNNLPDGLGWDHTKNIIETVPGVHVINISANPDSNREHSDARIYYLIKPINVNSIVQLIKKN